MGLVQLVAQEEIPPSCLRLFSGRTTADSVISVKGLKRKDAGVEGAVLARIIARGAVPAAVIELLTEEVADEVVEALGVVPVSGSEPHQHRDNAGLRASPSALPLPEALTPRKAAGCPVAAKPHQMQERVRRGGPLG